MKNILLIIVAIFILSCCNTQQEENKAIGESIESNYKDSMMSRINEIFSNPYRDINNLDFKTGNETIDNLNTLFSNDKQIVPIIKRDLCLGDYCKSFKTMVEKGTSRTLHFFKGDSGEHGFSNNQFMIRNDSLEIVRHFKVYVHTEPTDTSATLWNVEETLLYFYENSVKILERNIITKDLYKFDFSLRNIEFNIQSIHGENGISKMKLEELNDLLATENFEYE